jgi:Helix-loop-helix DNA-binding domain
VNNTPPSAHDDDITSTKNTFKKQKENDPLSWDYDSRRKFRNAREKERSCQINQQILELRTLLALGGCTADSRESKSTILDKTANYIKHLQREQHASQMERQHLIMSQQAHILRMGGCENEIGITLQLPKPNLLLQYASQPGKELYPSSHTQQVDIYGETSRRPEKVHIDEGDYRFVFEACSVGIVSCNTYAFLSH